MPAPVDVTDPFRALSDPTRREIARLLSEGPLPVRMIAANFPAISRPAVSKHLRILKEGRLVGEERSGRERYYHLRPATVASVLAWVQGLEGASRPTGTRSRAADDAAKRRRRERSEPADRSSGRKARPAPTPSEEPLQRPEPAPDSGDWKSW